MKEVCIDCRKEGVTTVRAIDPRSGPRSPRCATHIRARKKAASARSHARHIKVEFGMSAEVYWMLYAAQGGRCAICRKGRGLSRRLSVDHSHETGEVRGLLCSFCNYYVLGRLNLDALKRAVLYLEEPPARSILDREGRE